MTIFKKIRGNGNLHQAGKSFDDDNSSVASPSSSSSGMSATSDRSHPGVDGNGGSWRSRFPSGSLRRMNSMQKRWSTNNQINIASCGNIDSDGGKQGNWPWNNRK